MTEFNQKEKPKYLALMERKAQNQLIALFPNGDISVNAKQSLYRWSLSPLRVALFDGDTTIPELTPEEIEFVKHNHLNERERLLVLRYNFILQAKTLDELKARFPETQRISNEAETGLKGYENMRHLVDEQDILNAAKEGKLAPVPQLNFIKIDPEFQELSNQTFRHCLPELTEILHQLNDQIKSVLQEGQYVKIISAVRTTELQNLLIKLGYHAAPISTHTLGAALDVSSKEIEPQVAEKVWRVFEEAHKNEEIVFVREREETKEYPYKIAHLSITPKKLTYASAKHFVFTSLAKDIP